MVQLDRIVVRLSQLSGRILAAQARGAGFNSQKLLAILSPQDIKHVFSQLMLNDKPKDVHFSAPMAVLQSRERAPWAEHLTSLPKWGVSVPSRVGALSLQPATIALVSLKHSCNIQLQAYESIKLQNSVLGLVHMVVALGYCLVSRCT